MLAALDRFLNNTTMYRLMLLVLGAMAFVGIVFGFAGVIAVPGLALIASLACLFAACYGFNLLFARLFRVAANAESSAITALILFLILFPAERAVDYGYLALAGVIAMGSKYLVTVHRRHVFNPAAFGAVAIGLLGWGASWWVGSPAMLPVVAVGGFLIARKTRRMPVVLTFLAAALVSLFASAFLSDNTATVTGLLSEAFLSWPIVFFATVMLTEPLTLPASKAWQLAEATLVGLLFAVPYHIGSLYSTPELGLLIGNLFACAVGFKRTYRLRLEKKTELAPGVFDFAFSSDQPAAFEPGQYFEWTLAHDKPDARGNRRTFTVASSPKESLVRMGVRMPENPSSFKRALAAMKPGDTVFGSNLGGEFVLPRDPAEKLVFIAGGIGITPFRSMAQHLVEVGERRDIVLIYACNTESDFVYTDVFERAAAVGLRFVMLVTRRDGFLTDARLKSDVPDFADRVFYLSGPNVMVENYRKMLLSVGVLSTRIRTDYFPGY